MDGQRQTKFRFDGWTLHRDTGELARGEHSCRLQTQPLQILIELLENPGEVVTRERLIARLWPKGIVEFDASLNTAVRKLRIALNDDPEKPRYIETIPRRGYRFVARLEADAPAQRAIEPPKPEAGVSPRPVRPRWMWPWAGAGVILAITAALLFWRGQDRAEPVALLVLRFVDISEQPGNAALSLGITEEVTSRLAQLPELRVFAPGATRQFDASKEDLRTFGTSIGATHILQGSLRRDGDLLRVTVQLVDAADGLQMFSRSFEFPPDKVLDIEHTLAQAIAHALRAALSPERLRQWQARSARDLEAFDFYLRARESGQELTPDGADRAAELFALAIERDPRFARAIVGLAEAKMSASIQRQQGITAVTPEVEELIAAARELDSELPELIALEGWFAKEQGRLEDAVMLLQRAIALYPSDALSYGQLGLSYEMLGMPRKALEMQTRASELNPRDVTALTSRCMLLQDLARFDEAARACERARRFSPPNYQWAAYFSSQLEESRGDLAAALRFNAEAARRAPSDVHTAFKRVDLLVTIGLLDEAKKTAATIVSPDDAQLQRMQAMLVLAEHGPAALRDWLDRHDTTALSAPDTLADLILFYQLGGRLGHARAGVRALMTAPSFRADLFLDSSQVRANYSPALVCAAVLMEAGETTEAIAILDGVDDMLRRLEANGFAAHGLYAMRASSLALRGDVAASMRELRRAALRGWAGVFRRENEPWLAKLRALPELAQLEKETEARNTAARARFRDPGP